MKFSLKQTLLAVLLTLAFMLFTAPAAKAEVGTKSFGITNTIGLQLTNTSAANCGSAVKLENQDNCAIVFRGTGSDSGTSNLTFDLARSIDNSNWETTPRFTFVIPANGTTEVVCVTNVPASFISGFGYLKVAQVRNINANTLTNCSLTLGVKTIKAAP